MTQKVDRAMLLRAREAAKKAAYINDDYNGFRVSVQEYIKTFDDKKMKKADLTKPVELVERTNPNTGKTFKRLAFQTSNPKVFVDMPPSWNIIDEYEEGDTFNVDELECVYKEKVGKSEWEVDLKKTEE